MRAMAKKLSPCLHKSWIKTISLIPSPDRPRLSVIRASGPFPATAPVPKIWSLELALLLPGGELSIATYGEITAAINSQGSEGLELASKLYLGWLISRNLLRPCVCRPSVGP